MGALTWFVDYVKSLGLPKTADTSGPAEDEHPIVNPPPVTELVNHNNAGFHNGIYELAHAAPANPGRVGGTIKPQVIVVHTTDMLGKESDLIRAWQTTVTSGACAHFLVHRNGDLTQFVPINKNANHAGGPKIHGNYKTPGGALVHPNTVAVGIEIMGGGYLKFNGKDWIHPDSKLAVLASDVYVDSKHRGWQVITPAQFKTLDVLLTDLRNAIGSTTNLSVAPDGGYADNGVADYAPAPAALCGHVTLDPVNKMDPGPQVMAWLKEHYGN